MINQLRTFTDLCGGLRRGERRQGHGPTLALELSRQSSSDNRRRGLEHVVKHPPLLDRERPGLKAGPPFRAQGARQARASRHCVEPGEPVLCLRGKLGMGLDEEASFAQPPWANWTMPASCLSIMPPADGGTSMVGR